MSTLPEENNDIGVVRNGVTWCKSSVKFKNFLKVKKSLNSQKNLRISLAYQVLILEESLIALGYLKTPNSYFLCVK